MPTARRRLSPEDRRAELLALGAEVFGKRPYDEVRIDEIAERAGVSRALMYHYFPDKRAFFAAVVKDEADRLYAATNNRPPPRPDDVRRAADRRAGLHGLPRAEPGGRVGGVCRPGPVRPGPARHRRRSQEPPDGTHHDPHRRGRGRGPGAEAASRIVERDLRVILHGWLAFTFEICRQRIMDPTTDADRLADACAHTLLDAIARVHEIPDELAHAMATARIEPQVADVFVGACWHHG